MRDSTDPARSCRVLLLAVVGAALIAGCGGSSSSTTTAANVAGAGASSASVTRSTTAAKSHSDAPVAPGSGPLAFARCMRANGVPNFPDPSPGRGAVFQAPVGDNPAAPAFRTANAKCSKLMGGGGLPGEGPPPTAHTLNMLLKIAVCMRAHGISQFPDPRTSIPADPAASGAGVITDYDNAILVFPSTLILQAPAYKEALTACGAPPLGLPH